jgi:hypothetical protein
VKGNDGEDLQELFKPAVRLTTTMNETGMMPDITGETPANAAAFSSRRHTQGIRPQMAASVKRRFVQRRSSLIATVFFFLLFSGPPRFRIRDGEASLRGEVDWVVMLHIAVWTLAGLWVLYQVSKHKRLILQFTLPQKLGLAMVFSLAISAVVSKAPLLAGFKIYQMLISLAFVHVFVKLYGRQHSLKTIFWASALLCAAVAVGAIVSPDLVWTASDFNPDPSRLRGELIATTGVVSAFAMILLLTGVRKLWRPIPASLLGLFLVLLVLSLMRTAYAVELVFLALVLLKRPKVKPLRQVAYLVCLAIPILYLYHWLPKLSQYRDPGSIADLDDRVGLWRYLAGVTFAQSPWLGLGYYSASRVYGPEYNVGLGTAHSMFMEILLGGGVLSTAFLIGLCAVLSVCAARLLLTRRGAFSFATVALFIACVMFGFMGEEIDSGPVAICFWYSAAVLPWLCKQAERSVPKQIGKDFPAFAMGAKQLRGQTQ